MLKISYKKKFLLSLFILQSLLVASTIEPKDSTNKPSDFSKESILPSEYSEYLPDYTSSREKSAQAFLGYISSLFSTQYAPLKWKQKRYQLDLDVELSQALSDLKKIQNYSIENLKPIFSRLIDSSNDVHVGVLFEDSRIAIIPIQADWVEGKLIVTASFYNFIRPGDEIVTMNQKAPLDHLKTICYGSSDVEVTRPQFFCQSAFVRSGARMPLPHQGDSLSIQVRQANGLRVYEFPWYVTTINEIMSHYNSAHLNTLLKGASCKSSSAVSDKNHQLACLDMPLGCFKLNSDQTQFLAQAYNEIYGASLVEKFQDENQNPIDWINSTHEGEGSLDWKVFNQRGVSIGYIKISEFADVDFESVDEALKSLQSTTQALVIDLRGNPGGYDLSCFGLAARLTDQPLVNLMNSVLLDEATIEKHRDTAYFMKQVLEFAQTDEEVQNLFGRIEIEGQPVTLNLARALLREANFCIEEWDNGYTCSRFEPLRGMDKIEPHPTVRYTKPLYVLIDEKCASCADIFPALMKDNDRATLLGRTTSGAGGMIETLPITDAFGVESLSLTSSLLLRNNMMVIEDVGISPHFEHKKTVQSAINSNQEKMQAIEFAVRDITSKKRK